MKNHCRPRLHQPVALPAVISLAAMPGSVCAALTAFHNAVIAGIVTAYRDFAESGGTASHQTTGSGPVSGFNATGPLVRSPQFS